MAEAKTKKVVIKSNIKDRLPISQLSVLQGELKELPEENYKKLRRSILKHGFITPIFTWEDQRDNKIYILDGTQRFVTLNLMKKEGYSVPALPVVFIEADNINDAKAKLAAIASQFGKFTEKGVKGFFESFKFDEKIFETIEMPFQSMPEIFNKPKEVEVEGHKRTLNDYSEEEVVDETVSAANFMDNCPHCGKQLR